MTISGIKIPYDVRFTLLMAISTKKDHYEARLKDPHFNQDPEQVKFYLKEIANLKILLILVKMEGD